MNSEVLPVFASYRLAMVHMFASLPIALLLACRVRERWQVHRYAFILAAVFTLLLPNLLESVSWTLKQMESGFLIRNVIRCTFAIAIVFAWFATFPVPIAWNSMRAWTWTALLWFLLPSIYAWKQSEICRDEFDSNLAGMRIARAYHSLERLVETAGANRHQGIDVDDWRRTLMKDITKTERVLASATTDRSLNGVLQRAMQLMSLSRNAEAEQALLDAKSSDPQILLLLAISAREQQDYKKVELLCRQLRTDQREDTVMAFQLLCESLVGQRKIQEAIAAYELAIQKHPKHAGEFEMRLGTLLGEAGDVSAAIEHFNRAASIDPMLSQDAKKRVRGLQNRSCRF